jgi:hypothetical protein
MKASLHYEELDRDEGRPSTEREAYESLLGDEKWRVAFYPPASARYRYDRDRIFPFRTSSSAGNAESAQRLAERAASVLEDARKAALAGHLFEIRGASEELYTPDGAFEAFESRRLDIPYDVTPILFETGGGSRILLVINRNKYRLKAFKAQTVDKDSEIRVHWFPGVVSPDGSGDVFAYKAAVSVLATIADARLPVERVEPPTGQSQALETCAAYWRIDATMQLYVRSTWARAPNQSGDVQDRRSLRLAEKKARWAQLEAELRARLRALPDKRHGVIAPVRRRFEPYIVKGN